MRLRHRFLTAVVLGAALVALTPSSARAGDGGVDAGCVAVLASCTTSDVCCGGSHCGSYGDGGSLACGYALGACLEPGAACTSATECGCAQLCTGGKCASSDAGTDGGKSATDGGKSSSDAGKKADADIATGDAGRQCVALEQPCTTTDLCCGSGYCGDFGGTTGTTVCGLNTQNHQLSTGCSCDVTGAGGVGSAGLLAGLGLALGAIIRRRRR